MVVFIVKMFFNGEVKDEVIYDIARAMKFFDDLQKSKVVAHARLFAHHRVTAEF